MTTVVVGGGLAGAFCARALELGGDEEVVVVDAGDEPGGIARAERVGGYLLEPAVGSLSLPHPALSPLLDGLGLEVEEVPLPARRRFVRHQERTVEVRPGPGLLLSPLLSAGAKLRVLGEPLVAPGSGDETLQDFLVRRLGREAGRLGARLMAAGVHAGDPRALSVEAAFPVLAGLERAHGSLLAGVVRGRRRRAAPRPGAHVVRGATADIAGAVAGVMGERWRRSWRAERLEQAGSGWRVHGPERLDADRVVAAVDASRLAHLFPPVRSVVNHAPRAPVAVVFLGIAHPVLPDGFGVLVGPDEGFLSLGILYESSYAPGRAPVGHGLIKAILGGATAPRAVDLPDDELAERVEDELVRILGSAVEVDLVRVVRHRPGIPQYTAARRDMISRVRSTLPPGLQVGGWAFDGVGVSQLAAAAHRLGEPRRR